MRNSTRFIATIAAGGVVAGGAFALWQTPGSPKTTKTAVTQSAGNADSDAAMQNLVAEGTRLHAAVDAARTQLSQLTDATAPVDQATFALQAQQLAAAQQSLAADEALLAQLRGTAPRAPTAAVKQAPAAAAPHQARPTSYAPATTVRVITPTDNWQPPAQQTSSATQSRTPTPTPTPTPTQTRSPRPSSTPTQTESGDR